MPRIPPDLVPKLARPPPDGPHEVGYAKPPVASRFTPGRSGNPRGRPKGSRNRFPYLSEERLKIIIQAEAYRDIKVNDGKRQVTIPMAQAIIRSLAVGAAKGQQRSQRLFTELLVMTERENRAVYDAWFQTVIDYKNGWDQELERRKVLGISAPNPIPHPDDIVFCQKTGKILVKGPRTKEEKVGWDRLYQRVVDCDREIAALQKKLTDRKYKKYRRIIEQDIAFERDLRCKIVAAIGEPPERFAANERQVRD